VPRSAKILLIVGAVLALLGIELVRQLPGIAAGGLLYPSRQPVTVPAPPGCTNDVFQGAGVRLKGWRCAAQGEPRGMVVYLHGVADNRASSAGIVPRITSKGLEMIAYDSRAHGDSEGDVCTYGYFEKEDLRLVLDAIERRPIILIGASLGAAVALQEAPGDARVAGIVAVDTFSDLQTVARERAPFGLTEGVIERAFALAEERGHFRIADVSPELAAARLEIPVLLIHGTADTATPPAHSQRVLAALRGPKRLMLVEGAGHNQALGDPKVWQEIDAWIAALIGAGSFARNTPPSLQ